MRPIYIESNRMKKGHSKVYLVLAGVLLFLLVILVFVAPVLVKNSINKLGSQNLDFSFKVSNVELNILESEVQVEDVLVYSAKTSRKFIELPRLRIDFDWSDIWQDGKVLSLSGEVLDVTFSKDFISGIKKIKNDLSANKGKEKKSVYLKEANLEMRKINFRELNEDSVRTILSLTNVDLLLKETGLSASNEKAEFSLKSDISEGGKMHLSGKINPEAHSMHWSITGELSSIPIKVLEKLAGSKLPLDVKDSHISSKINAHSKDGAIEGVLYPEIKEFKVSESTGEGVLKRGIAKITNSALQKIKNSEGNTGISIPFTLKENFSLNFPDTLEKIIKQK